MIKLVVIVILIVLALSYWQIDLRGIVESETGQANFSFLGELVSNVWTTYLLPFWNFFKALIFDNLGKIWPN